MHWIEQYEYSKIPKKNYNPKLKLRKKNISCAKSKKKNDNQTNVNTFAPPLNQSSY